MPHDTALDRRAEVVWRWLAVGISAMLLYVASIGPMARVLPRRGETAYRVWQIIYGDPLGKLPKPLRKAVNWYIRKCSVLGEIGVNGGAVFRQACIRLRNVDNENTPPLRPYREC